MAAVLFSFAETFVCSDCAGAKTSNPAATNLVWAARPPFAHNEALASLR
jgi:hypothetical protein